MALGNHKIDQLEHLSHIASIINKDSGRSKDVKNKMAKAQVVFSTVGKCLEE